MNYPKKKKLSIPISNTLSQHHLSAQKCLPKNPVMPSFSPRISNLSLKIYSIGQMLPMIKTPNILSIYSTKQAVDIVFVPNQKQ